MYIDLFDANRTSFRSQYYAHFCALLEGKSLQKAALLQKSDSNTCLNSQITAIALFASSCPPKVGVTLTGAIHTKKASE